MASRLVSVGSARKDAYPADGQAVQARLVKAPAHARPLDSVGRHGPILDPRVCASILTRVGKVSAQESFTASKAYLVGSKLHEDGDGSRISSNVSRPSRGKPDVLLLWHAVLTAEVASVRD